MDTVTQAAIIGIDISRDWLNVHCLPGGNRARFPNKVKGHEQVAQLVFELSALGLVEGF